jgi:hypothetical protein
MMEKDLSYDDAFNLMVENLREEIEKIPLKIV